MERQSMALRSLGRIRQSRRSIALVIVLWVITLPALTAASFSSKAPRFGGGRTIAWAQTADYPYISFY